MRPVGAARSCTTGFIAFHRARIKRGFLQRIPATDFGDGFRQCAK
jgi:hypothetical protein